MKDVSRDDLITYVLFFMFVTGISIMVVVGVWAFWQ